jgi:rhodanese-related sulfurtransferase
MNASTRQRIVFLAISSSVAVLFAAGCAGEADISEVSQAEVVTWIEQGTSPLLLDVRTSQEYVSGHVPGAVNIPHDQLSSRLNEIRAHRDEQVVVYCERGGRAGKAAETLQGEGFTSIRHLTGDMSAWRSADLPTE